MSKSWKTLVATTLVATTLTQYPAIGTSFGLNGHVLAAENNTGDPAFHQITPQNFDESKTQPVSFTVLKENQQDVSSMQRSMDTTSGKIVEVNGQKMVVLTITRQKLWQDFKVDSGQGLQSVNAIALDEANDTKTVMFPYNKDQALYQATVGINAGPMGLMQHTTYIKVDAPANQETPTQPEETTAPNTNDNAENAPTETTPAPDNTNNTTPEAPADQGTAPAEGNNGANEATPPAPSDTSQANPAVGQETIDYEVYKDGTTQTSVMDGYMEKPAKLVHDNGKTYVDFTLQYADWWKSFELYEGDRQLPTQVILEDKENDKRVIRAEITPGTTDLNSKVHIIVTGIPNLNYNNKYTTQIHFKSPVPAPVMNEEEKPEENTQPPTDNETTPPVDNGAEQPSEDNNKPVDNDADKPAEDGNKPSDNDADKPSEDSNKPADNDADKPSEDSNKPVENDTDKPAEDNNKPVENDADKPAEDNNKPADNDADKPSEDGNKPADNEADKPAEDSNKPSDNDAEKPTEDNNKPSDNDADKPADNEVDKPAEDNNKPSDNEAEKPSEDNNKPSDNDTDKPSEDGNKPSDNEVDKPSDDSNKPADNEVDKPAEDGNKPADNDADKPSDNEVDKPAEDNQATQPTAPSTNPPKKEDSTNEAAQKVQNIGYQVHKDGTKEQSVMDTYMTHPAKLITKNGKQYVQVNLNNASWWRSFELYEDGKKLDIRTVSEANDQRLIEFEVQPGTKVLNSKVHIVVTGVPGLHYDNHYTTQLEFDQAIPEVEKDAPAKDEQQDQGDKPSTDDQQNEAPSTNDQQGDKPSSNEGSASEQKPDKPSSNHESQKGDKPSKHHHSHDTDASNMNGTNPNNNHQHNDATNNKKPVQKPQDVNQQAINFKVVKNGTNQISVMDGYMQHPAHLVTKDGKQYLEFTIDHASWWKAFDIYHNGQKLPMTTVKEQNDTRTVHVEVQPGMEQFDAKVHIVVPGINYDNHYTTQILLEKAVPEMGQMASDSNDAFDQTEGNGNAEQDTVLSNASNDMNGGSGTSSDTATTPSDTASGQDGTMTNNATTDNSTSPAASTTSDASNSSAQSGSNSQQATNPQTSGDTESNYVVFAAAFGLALISLVGSFFVNRRQRKNEANK
ncbi:NEAT domain-containing protein [Staphylococcus auricularis]|uniref:NEAT domain-containing protein n=1 Tax=Staphylococcus auricularis TaxID=29379 RepID=UPI002DB85E9E|nr:NEAT domain-containing protein [Staphylococcus auricularis]MEB6570445.1 NEAT domain-containing protein [Staphylococcus auricularis]